MKDSGSPFYLRGVSHFPLFFWNILTKFYFFENWPFHHFVLKWLMCLSSQTTCTVSANVGNFSLFLILFSACVILSNSFNYYNFISNLIAFFILSYEWILIYNLDFNATCFKVSWCILFDIIKGLTTSKRRNESNKNTI